ncbi:unnamed protein product [Gordionus sp. m RMFG-2023]
MYPKPKNLLPCNLPPNKVYDRFSPSRNSSNLDQAQYLVFNKIHNKLNFINDKETKNIFSFSSLNNNKVDYISDHNDIDIPFPLFTLSKCDSKASCKPNMIINCSEDFNNIFQINKSPIKILDAVGVYKENNSEHDLHLVDWGNIYNLNNLEESFEISQYPMGLIAIALGNELYIWDPHKSLIIYTKNIDSFGYIRSVKWATQNNRLVVIHDKNHDGLNMQKKTKLYVVSFSSHLKNQTTKFKNLANNIVPTPILNVNIKSLDIIKVLNNKPDICDTLWINEYLLISTIVQTNLWLNNSSKKFLSSNNLTLNNKSNLTQELNIFIWDTSKIRTYSYPICFFKEIIVGNINDIKHAQLSYSWHNDGSLACLYNKSRLLIWHINFKELLVEKNICPDISSTHLCRKEFESNLSKIFINSIVSSQSHLIQSLQKQKLSSHLTDRIKINSIAWCYWNKNTLICVGQFSGNGNDMNKFYRGYIAHLNVSKKDSLWEINIISSYYLKDYNPILCYLNLPSITIHDHVVKDNNNHISSHLYNPLFLTIHCTQSTMISVECQHLDSYNTITPNRPPKDLINTCDICLWREEIKSETKNRLTPPMDSNLIYSQHPNRQTTPLFSDAQNSKKRALRLLSKLRSHGGGTETRIISFCVSPDGTKLATILNDETLKLWYIIKEPRQNIILSNNHLSPTTTSPLKISRSFLSLNEDGLV